MFRRKPRLDSVKICFATDIHGSERCFRKFLNAGTVYKASYLILGGDITGKVLLPIERGARGYSAHYNDRSYVDLTDRDRIELENLIRANGQYPIVGEHDELVALADEAYREKVFRAVTVESVRRWVELAETRLRGTAIRCFITAGNDDFPEVDDALRGSEVVEYVEGRCVRLNDKHEMITTGYSNETPWRTPRELSEAELKDRIEAMIAGASDPSTLIMVVHPPPRNTQLDQAPQIDEDFRVVTSGGQAQLTSVGSTAVRDVIEQHQPLLSLHGHVHEGKAAQYLGRTLAINPGSEYTNGTLLCALVTLSDRGLSYQFTVG